MLGGAKGTEGADLVRKQDPFVAWSAVTNQLKDAATALISTKPALWAMDAAATSLANMAKTFQSGKVPENTNLGRAIKPQTPEERTELNRQDNEKRELEELNARLYGRDDDQSNGAHYMRLKRFDAQMDLQAARMREDSGVFGKSGEILPPFSDEELQRLRDSHVPLPTADPRRMRGGQRIPFPMSDPRKVDGEMTSGLPPVQTLEGGAPIQATLTGSAEVTGVVTIKNIVEAGSGLLKILSDVQQVTAALSGHLLANGPGSAGRSSPDAAAPARPSTGSPFSGY